MCSHRIAYVVWHRVIRCRQCTILCLCDRYPSSFVCYIVNVDLKCVQEKWNLIASDLRDLDALISYSISFPSNYYAFTCSFVIIVCFICLHAPESKTCTAGIERWLKRNDVYAPVKRYSQIFISSKWNRWQQSFGQKLKCVGRKYAVLIFTVELVRHQISFYFLIFALYQNHWYSLTKSSNALLRYIYGSFRRNIGSLFLLQSKL